MSQQRINMTKIELIEQLLLDIPEANILTEKDFRHVYISFEPLLWCSLEKMNCIFAPADTIEDFACDVVKLLQTKFPNQAPENIGLSKDIVATKRLSGSFHEYPDGCTLYVSFTFRNNKCKRAFEFYQ